MDETDWLLLEALSQAPRASNASLARALEVSESAIARRYRRLWAAGVRIHGTVDIAPFDIDSWTVRLQVTPSAAGAVAAALSDRPDTAWVYIASGGTEIIVNALLSREPGVDTLMTRLPKTTQVKSYTAHLLLDSPLQPGAATLRKVAPYRLTRARRERLAPPAAQATAAEGGTLDPAAGSRRNGSIAGGGPPHLTPADIALLTALARDGRRSVTGLATDVREPESTTRARLARLEHSGVLRFVVDIPTAVLGRPVEARMWLNVQPRHALAAAEQLAGLPDTTFVALTTGPTNLVLSVACSSMRDLAMVTTKSLAAVPGITHVETAPLHTTLKRFGHAPAGGHLSSTG